MARLGRNEVCLEPSETELKSGWSGLMETKVPGLRYGQASTEAGCACSPLNR